MKISIKTVPELSATNSTAILETLYRNCYSLLLLQTGTLLQENAIYWNAIQGHCYSRDSYPFLLLLSVTATKALPHEKLLFSCKQKTPSKLLDLLSFYQSQLGQYLHSLSGLKKAKEKATFEFCHFAIGFKLDSNHVLNFSHTKIFLD